MIKLILTIINMLREQQHLTESSYKCEECGKSYTSRGELDDHIRQMHGI